VIRSTGGGCKLFSPLCTVRVAAAVGVNHHHVRNIPPLYLSEEFVIIIVVVFVIIVVVVVIPHPSGMRLSCFHCHFGEAISIFFNVKVFIKE